jgi:hypothetical protein
MIRVSYNVLSIINYYRKKLLLNNKKLYYTNHSSRLEIFLFLARFRHHRQNKDDVQNNRYKPRKYFVSLQQMRLLQLIPEK